MVKLEIVIPESGDMIYVKEVKTKKIIKEFIISDFKDIKETLEVAKIFVKEYK